MSSSETSTLRAIGRAAAGLLLLGALTGCQVRPLYSTGGNTEAVLSSIGISEADTRVEQQVRNNLIFLLAGGAGEPAQPEYMLEMNVSVRNIGVLLDTVIVRSLLVPALAYDIGPKIWWPSKLAQHDGGTHPDRQSETEQEGRKEPAHRA